MLSSLSLHHFRCYASKEIQFDPQLTVLVGPNAIGKSSLLEALYLIGLGKSFRAGRVEEMIREREEVGRVTVKITNDELRMTNDESNNQLTIINDHTSVKIEFSNGEQKSKTEAIESQQFNNLTIEQLNNETPNTKYQTLNTSDTLETVLTRGLVQGKRVARKRFLLNGAGKRQKDIAVFMPVVLFEPQDLMLVLGSPSGRREYLDGVLSQADWRYAQAITTYQKGLRQRNRLLWLINEGKASVNQLEYWNQVLVEQGQYLQLKRKEYLIFTNGWLAVQEQDVVFEVGYKPSEISFERLESHYLAEVASGNTLVGPHRDDVEIRLQVTSNELQVKTAVPPVTRHLSHFGSRGQQRLAVLNLKLAELEYLTEKLEARPILLLDDIFSELDEDNREIVMKAVGQYQTVIATTEHSIPNSGSVANVIELGEKG